MNLISNKVYKNSELIRRFIKRNKNRSSGKIIFHSYLSKNFKGVEIDRLSILFETSSNAFEFEKKQSIGYFSKINTKKILEYIEKQLLEVNFHRNFILYIDGNSAKIADSLNQEKIEHKNALFLNSEDIYNLYLSSKSISVSSDLYIYEDKVLIYSKNIIYIIKQFS